MDEERVGSLGMEGRKEKIGVVIIANL